MQTSKKLSDVDIQIAIQEEGKLPTKLRDLTTIFMKLNEAGEDSMEGEMHCEKISRCSHCGMTK